MNNEEATMRTPAEIQEIIVALQNKQAEIDALYRDHLMLQTNPHLRDQQMALWEMARTLERWDREQHAIAEQLRVLAWVMGTSLSFPVPR